MAGLSGNADKTYYVSGGGVNQFSIQRAVSSRDIGAGSLNGEKPMQEVLRSIVGTTSLGNLS